jgi:hypothetical protein
MSLPKWRQFSRRFFCLFQILVLLDTISDWPWCVSWQHFYSQSLPTKKLQATLPISLPWRHATPTNIIHNSFVKDLQKNRCMRKELKLSDLCLRPKSAATTFILTSFFLSDARSILSTLVQFNKIDFCLIGWKLVTFCSDRKRSLRSLI